jgi:hypothetical protein
MCSALLPILQAWKDSEGIPPSEDHARQFSSFLDACEELYGPYWDHLTSAYCADTATYTRSAEFLYISLWSIWF